MSTYQSFYEETFYLPTVDYTPIRKRRMKNMSRIPSISHEILLTDDYDSDSYREGLRVQKKKCSCRFIWNYELHGLTVFLRSKGFFMQVLWGFIIAFCIVMALYTTKWVFEEYLERQTATLITFQNKPRQLLPTIAICPKNPDALNYPKVLRDIAKRFPHLDRVTVGNLIAFAIAGAGFHNMEHILSHFTKGDMDRLTALFRRWKGHRTLEEFFNDLFHKNGYRCEDMFQGCFYGYEQIPCCDVLRPYYVVLRGRCFRLDKMFQTDPDVFGRLNIYMNQLPSRLSQSAMKTGGMQPQVIVYISDKHPDVGTFPRYYINYHEAIYVRVRGRKIMMLEGNSQCSAKPEDKGKSTCFINKYLQWRLLNPLNCTVFYMRFKAPDYKVCEPEVIVKNYKMVNDIRLANDNDYKCLPACRRRDYILTLFRSESSIPRSILMRSPAFRFELSYMHLELERYEEVVTTTLPGFISQLGGQSGLFVGLSVCTLIQIAISLTTQSYRRIHIYFGGYYRGFWN